MRRTTTDNYHAESRSARRTTTKERRRPREFSSQRHHDIGTTKRREVSTTTTQRPRRRILTSRCVGINSDTKYTKTTASYPQICTDSHRLIWTSHRGGGLKRAFTTTARRRRDDDYSPSRCVGINSATRTRRREDDDRTDDGLICGDARRYGITTTKCHAEPRSSRRTRLRREPELVTYELIHAHFVQDIFEVITIYLKIQLHIAISETSNFL